MIFTHYKVQVFKIYDPCQEKTFFNMQPARLGTACCLLDVFMDPLAFDRRSGASEAQADLLLLFLRTLETGVSSQPISYGQSKG